MKVVKAKEMARIEQLAYAEGACEETFMNTAGQGVAELVQRLVAKMHVLPQITLLCGSGNNAGDAYVAATLLKEGGFDVVAYALAPLESSSELCQLQAKRFVKKQGKITFLSSVDALDLSKTNLIIDGILGTGFHGEVEGIYREVIEKANASMIPIVSIDVPSGVNGTTGEIGGVAIQASMTLFLGLPKTGCFMGSVWEHVGEISCFDFGLGSPSITQAAADYTLIDEALIDALFPDVKRTRHKYEAGYIVGLGGSPGMPGAPILSSFAALRAGAGIVRLLHPAGMEAELAHAPVEIIRQGYQSGAEVLEAMQRASALFIGPGFGTSERALQLLQEILPKLEHPCVLDAEALTLLAQHEIALPAQVVMTPHIGEMCRLLHLDTPPPFPELLELCRRYSEQRRVTLVLKGAPTFIFHPGEVPYISARGTPGMATAGSGDVLTGIVAAFMARTANPLHGALLGVHFHAVAGEVAADEKTPHCMVASDITEALPQAFAEL